MSVVPQLKFVESGLDAITLTWEPIQDAGYRLELREILTPEWTDCRSIAVTKEDISKPELFRLVVADLNPSSSYIFRLHVLTRDGRQMGPGQEIGFDTEVVSCAPKSETCCAIS